jgi:glycosyltransferase involved in cell wall biosynthesis
MLSEICIVIPAYDAAKTVGEVVSGALRHVSKVIVADDGSSDTTAAVASASGAEVITIDKNKGKGNALKLLFQKAFEEGYEVVISMDADGQHDPKEIPKFLASHKMHPDDIIVGSRMKEKEKIPRARYNSMHIARFYISLFANQFIEDTQSGFRLYPMKVVRRIRLMTERYVTESELLMKAGDMGVTIRFIGIRTIYGENGSHFRPIMDITLITAYVISYGYTKWLIEGVTSNNPETYRRDSHPRDYIGQCGWTDVLYQAFTALTAPPASIFFLLEYMLLPALIPNNLASVRRLGHGFFKITIASQMLPFVLVVAIIEKLGNKAGFKLNLVDGFVSRFFPHLWNNEKV